METLYSSEGEPIAYIDVADAGLLLPVTLAQHLVCVNLWTTTLTSEMRWAGPTRATR